MKLGIALPHYDISFPDQRPATFDRVARYAELAESAGFHQLWVSDHFWLDLERYGGPAGRQGTPECWTMLSALAVLTSRARLGTLVLATGFRPPTLLAKMAATLDQLADGRLDLGLGAGWNEAEFTENGLPFPRPGERLAMLEEALGVLRALLTDAATPASFSGRYYHADQAPVLPGPVQRPRPPLWVGGKGDRLLGVVARAADGWNICWAVTEADYQERAGVLAAACRRAGRDPGEVRRSVGLNTLIGTGRRRPGRALGPPEGPDPERDPGRGRAARLGRLPAGRHPRRGRRPAAGLGGAGGRAGDQQLRRPAVLGVRGRAAGAGRRAGPAPARRALAGCCGDLRTGRPGTGTVCPAARGASRSGPAASSSARTRAAAADHTSSGRRHW